MKLKPLIIAISMIACLSSCIEYEPNAPMLDVETWDMPMGLSSSNSVVWNDTLYILFGREGQRPSSAKPLGYAISLNDPTIVRKFDLPMSARVKAAGVLVGSKYYFGLGFYGEIYNDPSYLTDWWCYDFSTRQLKRLADMIAHDTDGAIVWAKDDSKIYLSLGYDSWCSQRTYRYDIPTNSWTIVSENSIRNIRFGALGGCVNGRSFSGAGCMTEMFNDWNEYNYKLNRWEKRQAMPSAGRIFAATAVARNEIYVLGGRYFGGTETDEHFYNSIIVYHIATNSWQVLGLMPEAAEQQIAAYHRGYLYWGLGQDANGQKIQRLHRHEITQ